jgi:hypothetical protein
MAKRKVVRVLRWIPGEKYMAGDVVEVDAKIAERWLRAGFAAPHSAKVQAAPPRARSRKA